MTDREILRLRPPKNVLDSLRPYAFLAEPERSAGGVVEDVATIFLTNRECPFRCTMCDLWKNTLDETVPKGAIPAQIDYALFRLPAARHIKLYNSGNFFDPKAIPQDDYPAIIERVRGFQTVIVENHPKFCGEACLRFRDKLKTDLEIAIGLETVHPEVLARLNKHMTVDDFERACRFLRREGIAVRAFILVKPPFLSEAQGVDWAVRSMEFAFAAGVGCCSLVPTRAGNGAMDALARQGDFAPPTLSSLEDCLDAGIELVRGTGFQSVDSRAAPIDIGTCHPRVLMDLWDIERAYSCPRCAAERIARMRRMNLSQSLEPRIPCNCEAVP